MPFPTTTAVDCPSGLVDRQFMRLDYVSPSESPMVAWRLAVRERRKKETVRDRNTKGR